MIEPVIQPNARDHDTQVGHVSEIRQPHPARFMDLAEDNFLIRAMDGSP